MLLLGVVVLLVASSATEAAPQRTDIVRGVVRTEGTGRPIHDAQVAVMATRFGTVTDREGQYETANVPEGRVRLQIRAIGYATQTVIVSVSITLPYFVSRKVRPHTWDTRFFESCCERRGRFTYSW